MTCSLTSIWGRHSLNIYLKLQYLPPNIPYSLPYFIFLHCTYRHLTCNPFNLLILLFSVLSPPRMLRQRSVLFTAINPSTQASAQ